jgi:hypothetical protein
MGWIEIGAMKIDIADYEKTPHWRQPGMAVSPDSAPI